MRRATRTATSLAAGVTLTFGLITALAPASASAGTPDCIRAPGLTYDYVRYESCYMPWNGQNSGVMFDDVAPATGVWACTVPSGFTYTQVEYNTDCDGWGVTPTPKYLLAKL